MVGESTHLEVPAGAEAPAAGIDDLPLRKATGTAMRRAIAASRAGLTRWPHRRSLFRHRRRIF